MDKQREPVTTEQALEALDNMDDYAGMDIGVDPIGPRETLERFIRQAAQAAPVEAVACVVMQGGHKVAILHNGYDPQLGTELYARPADWNAAVEAAAQLVDVYLADHGIEQAQQCLPDAIRALAKDQS